MKAIVSVFAKDSKGITAYVTALERGLDIHIQRQDIFEAMHRI